MPHASPLPPVVLVTAHEWRWLALAVVLGAAIRLMYLDRVAVEHFDEGVYAANVWFGAEEGYQYPLRQFYAPPLLPALIEWCYVAWGFTGMKAPAWLPMVPSLLCGIATIPSAWWIARQWFGPAAGYTAMWLVALNEFHAAYSRTALTDVPVTLAILWAVFAAWRLLLDPTVKNGVITGVLTAIAWWLKYSGWLPLAILLVGGAVFQCLVRSEERRWKAWSIATVVAVLTAGVLWLPVLSDCQAVGGYSAVAANHRGYIMGWSHWWGNLVTLSQCHEHYLSVLLFVAIGVWLSYSLDRNWTSIVRWQYTLPAAVLIFIAAWLVRSVSSWVLMLTVATTSMVLGILARCHSELSREETAAGALASTWFVGLFLMTPLYQPYPRLLLPWWLASILLTCWVPLRFGSQSKLTEPNELLASRRTFEWPKSELLLIPPMMIGLLALLVALSTTVFKEVTVSLREDRRSFRNAAEETSKIIRQADDQSIAQVYGLPPVVLALRERGVAAVVCGGPEAAARLAGSWVIVSSDADRDSTWNDHWPKVADQFELVRTIDINPSSIVRLDNGPLPPDPPPVEVRVYRHR